MKRYIIALILVSLFCANCFSEENIFGKYYIENAVEDFQGTKEFSISVNEYNEIIVSNENISSCVAYYDEENNELFFVIKRSAQYDTFMKFKFHANRLQVYSLVDHKWCKNNNLYKKNSKN